MIDTADLSMEMQITRWNAARSDPVGWSIDHDLHQIQHCSGLYLHIGRRSKIDTNYTALKLPYTRKSIAGSRSGLDTDTLSSKIEIKKFGFCGISNSHIPSCFEALNGKAMDADTRTLIVFQHMLRLNFTAAGKIALCSAQDALMLHILRHNSEASGHWNFYLRNHTLIADAETSDYANIPLTLDDSITRALIHVGLPISTIGSGPAIFLSDLIDVHIPPTAHARAALLHRLCASSP